MQEKPQFWKRRPSIVKCNMLLLAHLGRAEVPPSLQGDLKFVLKRAPQLLEEMITIANWPRTQALTGWLTPTVGCLEMTQCITQALSTSSRKLLGQGSAKVGAGRPARPCIATPCSSHVKHTCLRAKPGCCWVGAARCC